MRFDFKSIEEVDSINFDDHLTDLIDYVDEIELDKINVLTGSNSSGKSFIRKLTGFEGYKVMSASMERRTVPNEDFSAFKSLAIDDAEKATSMNTFHLFKALFNSQLQENGKKFIILDEPEIGMGKEVLMGFLARISEWIDRNKEAGKFHGALIITHNEMVINHFMLREDSKFLNMEGLTKDEWFNRTIEPLDPEIIEHAGYRLWRAIEARKRAVKDGTYERKEKVEK